MQRLHKPQRLHRACRQVVRKCPVYRTGVSPMDAEHINLIGSTLNDLSARTQKLRGYL